MSFSILILDDEPWQLSWLDDVAKAHGGTCTYASTFDEAVSAYDNSTPSLVIVDVRIGDTAEPQKGATLTSADPTWIGLRFVRFLRAERNSKAKIFVYTGLDREEIRTIVVKSFHSQFFTKFESSRFSKAVIAEIEKLKKA